MLRVFIYKLGLGCFFFCIFCIKRHYSLGFFPLNASIFRDRQSWKPEYSGKVHKCVLNEVTWVWFSPPVSELGTALSSSTSQCDSGTAVLPFADKGPQAGVTHSRPSPRRQVVEQGLTPRCLAEGLADLCALPPSMRSCPTGGGYGASFVHKRYPSAHSAP